jgi:hypothetical protein
MLEATSRNTQHRYAVRGCEMIEKDPASGFQTGLFLDRNCTSARKSNTHGAYKEL